MKADSLPGGALESLFPRALVLIDEIKGQERFARNASSAK